MLLAMLHLDTAAHRPPPAGLDPRLSRALERSALALGRLDNALSGHPLAPAWRHWTRLEAAARHAAIDGLAVDPMRLAGLLEGLRLSARPDLPKHERGQEHQAIQHALDLFLLMRALDDPPRDEEGAASEHRAAVLAALGHLADERPRAPSVLTAAGTGLLSGLEAGIGRGPLRAALPHFLVGAGLVRSLMPGITGADALHGDSPKNRTAWLGRFLEAVAAEAEASLADLRVRTGAWRAAHQALAAPEPGRRRVRADALLPCAADLLAAAPFLGPAGLARTLGCSLRGAGRLLDQLAARGIAAEVTGRTTHKLYALAADPAHRPATAGPRRSERTRLRPLGRTGTAAWPPALPPDAPPLILPTPSAPRPPLEADFSALFAETDRAIQQVTAALTRAAVRNEPP